jgi:hypothetical protein
MGNHLHQGSSDDDEAGHRKHPDYLRSKQVGIMDRRYGKDHEELAGVEQEKDHRLMSGRLDSDGPGQRHDTSIPIIANERGKRK